MGAETVDLVLRFLEASGIRKLDVTGGAPELNPHFRQLVRAARELGVHVMDRCNLTITEQPGQEDLVDFLAANRVEVIASLPCYLEENVDQQRGKHVFEASMRALRKLNAAGYAQPGTGLVLTLVYNPLGPSLPPAQQAAGNSLQARARLSLTALSSTSSSRWPTCRSSASAARSSPRGSSSPT